jgi:peptidoglycan/LPS O-acetylase OafA/YrhL
MRNELKMPITKPLAYRPDIEGLRALAVLLVVAAHVGIPGVQGGFVGVDVFFVLSGYLITALLTLEIRATGTVDFWAFYARRFRRLAPGLLLMLFAVCLLAKFALSPMRQTYQASAATAAALWVSNFYFTFGNLNYFSPAAESSLFLHTWSLGVEEQFYLVWPLLLLLAFSKIFRCSNETEAIRFRRLKAVMTLVFMGSLALCFWLVRTHPISAFYMMPARAWQFCLGALTWLYLSPSPTPKAERVGGWLGWFGLALILLAGLGYDTNAPYPGWRALLPSLGAALVIAAGSHRTGGFSVSALFSLRPLQAVGRVSYAWYLWHWPVLVAGSAIYVQTGLAMRVALALLSLVLATISYRCVERPIHRHDALLRYPKRMVAGMLAALLLTGGLALLWEGEAMEAQFGPAYERFRQAYGDNSKIHGLGCDTWYKSAEVTVCQFGEANASHTAVLMGDSIGAQWFPALESRFTQTDWRLLVITKSACPMVDKPFCYARIGEEYTVCAKWRRRALEFLRETKPELVFLGSATNSGFGFSAADWTEGTRKVLQVISPHVGEIIVIRGTPVLPFDALDCLANTTPLTLLLAGENRCAAVPDATQGDQVFSALRKAASGFPNVRLLDMNEAVCPERRCLAEQDDFIVFRDSQHLTTRFAARLADVFMQRLEELWRSADTAAP